jgi:hypothetical protein
MMRRCLFCHTHFPENGRFQHIPLGRRIAYDPVRGRLWTVCGSCFRWTLVPVEDRDAALYELERAAHDQAVPVAHTSNVALLALDQLFLIRVGEAGLAEQAWWRYGRELQRRRASFDSAGSRLTAYTFGAMAFVGEVMGLSDPDLSIDWKDTPVQDILRWRRFGWAAWRGRVRCPYCNSTLRALRYDLSWWVYPLRGEGGGLSVGVPCPRCDPWTPEHVYMIEGPQAENVLRRCLAYQNISGAGEGLIRDAARVIEDSGSVGEFTVTATERRQSLWKMGQTGAVALEIALSESVEERMLDLEMRAIEFLWRQEEELARIIDEELTPRRLLEAHLRRLPVRLRPRHEPRILADPGGSTVGG